MDTASAPLAADQAVLEAVFFDLFGRDEPPPAQHQEPADNVLALSDTEIIERAQRARNGLKFNALWNGSISGYPSASEAESALAMLLAFWTHDEGQVERIIRGTSLERPKWDEARGRTTYIRQTISNANKRLGARFTPDKANNYAATPNKGVVAERKAEPKPTTYVTASDVSGNKPEQEVSNSIPIIVADIGEHASDMGNADRLVRYFGSYIKHTKELGWLAWDGKRWLSDEARVTEFAKRVVLSLYEEAYIAANTRLEARRKELARHADRSESRRALESMVAVAQSNPTIRISAENLDRNPDLLNVSNGTIDLRSGELCPHRQTDLISKLVPIEYDPQAKAPEFEKFVSEVFAEKEELINYIQRLFGYTLTGHTREQMFGLCWGEGSNGKTTLLERLKTIMGEYAVSSPADTFMPRKPGAPTNDLARLAGKRLVIAVETSEGRRLDEEIIKKLTGGDTVSARFLNREFFDFSPVFKLFIVTNHKPVIRGTDPGIWRRVRLVPFTQRWYSQDEEGTPKRDERLVDKLQTELPGILAWAVRGAVLWHQSGLATPSDVLAATKGYREEMDLVGRFLTERCERDPNLKPGQAPTLFDTRYQITAKSLYEAFVTWCESEQQRPISKTAFGQRLPKEGFTSVAGYANARLWVGLCLVGTEQT